MPNTSIYGLPFEQTPDDQPGITLHGGTSGTETILAESVETELARIDQDITDANAAIVEAAKGWVPIVEDFFSGTPPFTVDLTVGGKYPAGTFSVVKIYATGSLSGSAGHVTMRVNNDITADLHESARIRQRASDGSVVDSALGTGTIWRIGRWGTLTGGSSLECTIFNTDTSNFLTFKSSSGAIGSTASVSHETRFWGRLNDSRLLDSLRFDTFDAAADYDGFAYQIEGWVAP